MPARAPHASFVLGAVALAAIVACHGAPPREAAPDAGATSPTPTPMLATSDAAAATVAPDTTDRAPSAPAAPPSDAAVPPDRPSEKPPGAPPETDAFAALRALPLTLHYLVNGAPVTCQLQDAGVPDSDLDFKVRCTPSVPWRCVSASFPDIATRAAPDFWRAEGCYAARADGLYYFASCPSGPDAKAAFDDPAKAKGVRMLSAKMLEAPPATDDPSAIDERRDLRIAAISEGPDTPATSATPATTTELRVACTGATDRAMMKTIATSTCMSPRYGYVASDAEFTQMLEPLCHDWSVLVAVQSGLAPAQACAPSTDVLGHWRFATRVVAAKNATAIGVSGRYALTLSPPSAKPDPKAPPNPCALAVHLDKLGIDKRDFEPTKVQKGDALAYPAPCPAGFGTLCYQIPIHLEDEHRAGLDVRFVLSLSGDTLRGLWQYEKGAWKTTGYAGVVAGTRGDAPPKPANAHGAGANAGPNGVDDRPELSELARCTVKNCHFQETPGMATALVCASPGRADCLSGTP